MTLSNFSLLKSAKDEVRCEGHEGSIKSKSFDFGEMSSQRDDSHFDSLLLFFYKNQQTKIFK